MSVKREVKAFTEDGEQHWEGSMTCPLGENGKNGYVAECLLLRKELAGNVPWKPCIHISLYNFRRQRSPTHKRSWGTGFTLQEDAAKSLRNWLIEQYPLELTEIALLKSKMEQAHAN